MNGSGITWVLRRWCWDDDVVAMFWHYVRSLRLLSTDTYIQGSTLRTINTIDCDDTPAVMLLHVYCNNKSNISLLLISIENTVAAVTTECGLYKLLLVVFSRINNAAVLILTYAINTYARTQHTYVRSYRIVLRTRYVPPVPPLVLRISTYYVQHTTTAVLPSHILPSGTLIQLQTTRAFYGPVHTDQDF